MRDKPIERERRVVAPSPNRSTGLERWLVPTFDETTVLLMAVATVVLLAVFPQLREWLTVSREVSPPAYYVSWLVLLWSGIGLGFAIIQPFTKRPKGSFVKTSMALFVMVSNASAGILVGLERMQRSSGTGLLLPILNISTAVLLLYQIALTDGRVISDDDADLPDVVLSLSALGVLLFVCITVYEMSWPMTFSICVTYTTLIHSHALTATRTIRARWGMSG